MINKKGQMKITFGLIFSIILIIVFISFAFFGIKKFVEIQCQMNAHALIEELENDVNKMWGSSSGNVSKNYSAPRCVIALCFEQQEEDSQDHNVYFVQESENAGMKRPVEWIGDVVEHLDWLEIRRQRGYGNYGLCFEPDRYKNIGIILSKDYTDVDVAISRPLGGNPNDPL